MTSAWWNKLLTVDESRALHRERLLLQVLGLLGLLLSCRFWCVVGEETSSLALRLVDQLCHRLSKFEVSLWRSSH